MIQTNHSRRWMLVDDDEGVLAFMREIIAQFGGIEAEKVKSMVEQTALKEYETKKFQRSFTTKLFAPGDKGNKLPAPDFYLWIKLIENMSNISVISERLANRIRMVLELK